MLRFYRRRSALPFRPDPFLNRVEPLRRLRQRPMIGFCVAILAVAASVAVRLVFGDSLREVPFITFFPAIAVAAAVGGVRAGSLALLVSASLANYWLLPPYFAFSTGRVAIVQTLFFVMVAGLILFVIEVMNQAIDRMARLTENARLLLEAQPTGVVAVDAEGRIHLVNSAVERQLGYSRDELIDQSVEMLLPFTLRADHAKYRTEFMANPGIRQMGAGRDLNALTKDGDLLPVEIGLSPVVQNGRSGALATIVDISERKNLERRAQILSNEVRHRSRNLLTLVQAIATRKLPDDVAAEFTVTLTALGRTHDILGTEMTAPLRSIIEGELAGFGEQLSMEDCDLLLTPRAAQDFTLIIHELATNALKYGALSDPHGQVMVSCSRPARGICQFIWQERGGPPVAPPARHGFGQTILKEIARSFCTKVEIEFAEEGLRYALTMSEGAVSVLAELRNRGGGR